MDQERQGRAALLDAVGLLLLVLGGGGFAGLLCAALGGYGAALAGCLVLAYTGYRVATRDRRAEPRPEHQRNPGGTPPPGDDDAGVPLYVDPDDPQAFIPGR